jgi:hypothetical protein
MKNNVHVVMYVCLFMYMHMHVLLIHTSSKPTGDDIRKGKR